MAQTVQIDWGSAEVDDGRLTVPLTGTPSKKWADTVSRVLDRLQRGERWGEIKVTKKQLRVDAVEPGTEADLRHLLESAVLQANSDVRATTTAKPRTSAPTPTSR